LPRNSGSPTPDGGLCASLYAASEVTANVGDGTSVTISEETDYPFDELITLKLATPRPVKVSAAAAHPALVRQTAAQITARTFL